MELEEIRRKAQNAITATDKEWAAIVIALLDELDEADAELKMLRPLVAGDFDYHYGG